MVEVLERETFNKTTKQHWIPSILEMKLNPKARNGKSVVMHFVTRAIQYLAIQLHWSYLHQML